VEVETVAEQVDPDDVAVHGDDSHRDHRTFVVWRGEDAEGECDAFHDYDCVGVVVAAAVVVEGNIAERGQSFDVLVGRSAAI
jgi:hypothetical protein